MQRATVGLDLGSSGLKAIAFEFFEDRAPSHQILQVLPNRLHRPQPGWVEIDPAELEASFRQLMLSLPPGSTIGIATAMHSLVLVDEQLEPLTPIVTWSDSRSTAEAQELKKAEPEQSQRTGTPVHPMAWPSKILWFMRHRPDLWQRCSQLLDQKTFLLRRLTGTAVPIDRCSAGSTGLYDSLYEGWDEKLLARLELESDRLPQVAPSETELEVPGGHRLVLGGGDGPLANLGAGAVGAKSWAVSIGTSAAVRALVPERPKVDGRLFCYPLSRSNWALGGALSNGTSLLDWFAKLSREAGGSGLSAVELLRRAEAVPPGSQGLLVVPYLSGERSPWWHPDASGIVEGLRFHHGLGHLVRGFLEGLAFCLRAVIEIMAESVEPPQRLLVGGGLSKSGFFLRMLAQVLGRPLWPCLSSESSALGAAFLATGIGPEQWSHWVRQFPLGEESRPDAATSQLYQELFERHRSLYPHWREL